jgi:hypothetical protein
MVGSSGDQRGLLGHLHIGPRYSPVTGFTDGGRGFGSGDLAMVVAGASAREPPRSSPGGELGRWRQGINELGAHGGV